MPSLRRLPKKRRVRRMFKRTGTTEGIELVSFKKSMTEDVVCQSCKRVIGRRSGKFIKFSGSSAVVVSPEYFICAKCGEKNKCSKG